ncbi:GNAT family N-acetyltransferase [Nocardiopsis sp. CNR-923]|uniref:GNAT family N-acetyltransferase n=1 Tax=Nocardiopsis sp. CNR-923 TaxID=1904965 RepID=UPI0009617455|nr:GNAT family N-acetyltransferase [Nocardiopsis sp. CNR-923]OLT25864.1 GNAT family N-acetyltransferase [Nocardiopsis sp. CNR-923]
MPDVSIRTARPSDHLRIIGVCDAWWGRPIADVLPRLFLDHFHTSSLTAEVGEELAGFLVGFASPSRPEEAYVHFVGVAPEHRRSGLASRLYTRLTKVARVDGRSVVRAVTSPVNARSIAFHRALGFTVTGPHTDHDGPGEDRMVLELRL